MLGATYPEGFLDDPRNYRTRSSLMLCGPTGNVLVDCAPEMRLQVTGQGITDIEAVIITHSHADHVMGMDDLRSICMKTGQAMPVYTLPPYQDDIRRIYNYAFRDFPTGVFVPRFDLRDVPEVIHHGGMDIYPFEVEHGNIPVIALRVMDFVYMTDVSAIPPKSRKMLENLDVLVIDAVRFKPHPNHFHFEKALAVIAEFEPKRAFLTHLSHDYDHRTFTANLPKHIELAYDGLVISI